MTTTSTVQTPASTVCMFCVQPTARESSILNTQIPVNGIYIGLGGIAAAIIIVSIALTVMGRSSPKKTR
jgi:hypothetical protein